MCERGCEWGCEWVCVREVCERDVPCERGV